MSQAENMASVQGFISLAPAGSLERIAKLCKVPLASLAKVVVPNKTEKLYSAIVQYAALNSTSENDCPRPVMVDSFEPPHEQSDDEGSAEEDDEVLSTLSIRTDWHSRVSAMHIKMKRNRALRQQRKMAPEFKLSFGETSIVWPPPLHLQAAALVEKRDAAQRRRRERKNKDGLDTDVSENTESPNGHAVSSRVSAEKEHVIHLVHYAVGVPRASGFGPLSFYSEILMATPESPEIIHRFLEEVTKWAEDMKFLDGEGRKFALHRFKVERDHSWWHSEGMKRARPPSSVILPKGQLKAIMNDIRCFISPETKRWYFEHGLPHRRSYLFYGPPGTGKTSTIRAIASTFRLNCCFLSMTNVGFSNQDLCDALSEMPARALVVLEDVDALFNEDRKNEQGGSLTFSGLLNALDGLVSTDGVITVMTTNHIDRLDNALIRGGRVDRRFFFNKPSNDQLKDLFRFFYPGASEEVAKAFLEAIVARPEGDEARSIATLQQLFIDQRGNSAEDCVQAVPSFYEAHFPDGTTRNKAFFYT